MKVCVIASVALALLLVGCTSPTNSTRASSSTSTGMQNPYASANYHSDRFGEMNNDPFMGQYGSR